MTITGRLKELIVTSGGENVSPVPIENKLLELLPEVSNAILVGDKRNFLSCMFCLKTEMDPSGEPTNVLAPSVLEKSKELGSKAETCEQAAEDPLWHDYLGTAVEKYNKEFAVSNAQNIRKWIILKNDISLGKGELTATMKMKRSVVMRNYEKEISTIYETANTEKAASSWSVCWSRTVCSFMHGIEEFTNENGNFKRTQCDLPRHEREKGARQSEPLNSPRRRWPGLVLVFLRFTSVGGGRRDSEA